MEKIFAIYYARNVDNNGKLFPEESDRQFNKAILDICDVLTRKNVRTVLITQQNPYVGNGQFFGYWKPEENHYFSYVNQLIRPSLIFDKGHIDFNDGFLHFFNSHDFARLGRNKYTQSVIANGFLPRTQLVCSKDDYEKVLANIKTEIIVAKPLDKSCGNGVAIYNRNELNNNQHFPIIMQEFVETNGGIDGLVEGRHDLRLYVLNGEVILCSIRQPIEGGWLSNTHQGGSVHFYDKSKVPSELIAFAKPIIEAFDARGGEFYSVDFMHGNNRWYMVEMNDRPGMPALYQDKSGCIMDFYNKFTETIIRELAN